MTLHIRRAVAALFVALSSGWLAAQSDNVAGKWDLSVKAPHGEVRMGLDLKQDGTAVSGMLVNFRGKDLAVRGQYSDGSLTLSTADDEIALSAKVREDGSLAGYLSTAMGDLTWTATRAKAAQ